MITDHVHAESAFETKAQIRRDIEAAGIPYTYVLCFFFFFYLLNHPVYIYCQRHDILKAIKVVRKIQNSFEKKITSEHIITNELFSKTVSSLIIRSVNQQEKTTT